MIKDDTRLMLRALSSWPATPLDLLGLPTPGWVDRFYVRVRFAQLELRLGGPIELARFEAPESAA